MIYQRVGLSFAIGLLVAGTLQAEIVSSALLAFPAKTESLEYDNLYQLRRLPNYPALRQRFAGKQLDDAKVALARFGIDESQVHEIVMGTSPQAFYGMVGGTFSTAQAMNMARKKGLAGRPVGAEQVFCPGGTMCVVFLEEGLAAFGPAEQVKEILETRLGTTPRLGANRNLVDLLNGTERNAPVRGVVYGSELNSVISDALHDESGLNLDWKQFSGNISAFGYSVNMDSRAHVVAKMRCKSIALAGVLRQMLGALGGVQSMATKVGKDPNSMPFQNLQVSSSGDLVDLKMDTPLPTA